MVTNGDSSTCIFSKIHSFKDEGNVLFKRKLFEEAILKYSEGLSIASITTENSSSTRNVLATLFCNRAACHLALSSFSLCCEDCNSCLLVDPFNIKALYRKALALFELNEFSHCKAVCDELKLVAGDKLTNDLIILVNEVISQQNGIYNFLTLPFESKLQSKRKMQQFVGPLLVKRSIGRGRGLFLTREIKAGQILLVEKAFAIDSSHRIVSTIQNIIQRDGFSSALLYYLCRQNLSTDQLSLPDVRWYQPSYMNTDTDGVTPLESTRTVLTHSDIESILQLNSFLLSSSPEPDFAVRESIQKTIAFLCSPDSTRRTEEQSLQPATALQEYILMWSDCFNSSRDSCRQAALASGNAQLDLKLLYELIHKCSREGTLNSVDRLGLSALHYAVLLVLPIVVDALIQHPSIDVNVQDLLGYSPMHYAAGQCFDKSVLMSIVQHREADVNLYSKQFLTPLSVAMNYQNEESLHILLRKGANPLAGHPYPLFHSSPYQAAQDTNNHELIALFEHYLSKNSVVTPNTPCCKNLNEPKTALWLLASYFNHSMEANTVRLFVGDFIFVYAAKNLNVDEELFICYSRDPVKLPFKMATDIS